MAVARDALAISGQNRDRRLLLLIPMIHANEGLAGTSGSLAGVVMRVLFFWNWLLA